MIIKKIRYPLFSTLIHACLLLSGAAISGAYAEPKLWAVYDQNSDIRGYLFGTVHLPIPGNMVSNYFPQLIRVLDKVDTVAFERKFSHIEVQRLVKTIQFPEAYKNRDSTDFGRQPDHDKQAAVERTLKGMADSRKTDHGKTKEGLIQHLAQALFGGVALDARLYAEAEYRDKKLIGLESDEEQNERMHLKSELINYLSHSKKSNYCLNPNIYTGKLTDQVEQVTSFYMYCYLDSEHCHLSGTSNAFVKHISSPDWFSIQKNIINNRYNLYYRNYCWISTIKDQLQKKLTLFVVGQKHLTDKNNLIQLLSAEGYTIVPVPNY